MVQVALEQSEEMGDATPPPPTYSPIFECLLVNVNAGFNTVAEFKKKLYLCSFTVFHDGCFSVGRLSAVAVQSSGQPECPVGLTLEGQACNGTSIFNWRGKMLDNTQITVFTINAWGTYKSVWTFVSYPSRCG